MASDRLRFDSFNPALFETRSLPSSLATTHRGFAFYVAFPKSSIRPAGLPMITRTPACLRQLPWLRCHLPALFPIATCSMPLASLWLPRG